MLVGRVRLFFVCSLLFLVASSNGSLLADDTGNEVNSNGILWHKGPYKAKLSNVAEMDIPKGYAFTDGEGAKRFMELAHNPTSGSELGLILPIRQDTDSGKSDTRNSGGSWFLLFEFAETGYVPDNEKNSLDADKILENLKTNTENDNEYRKKQGWAAYHVTGWQTPPFYDEKTHNLTWATPMIRRKDSRSTTQRGFSGGAGR